jgi:hypothetical protein
MDIKKTITVVLMEEQCAEDLFRDIETRRVYIRQPCADKNYVTWLTSVNYGGFYEADTPLETGVQIDVVNEPRKNETRKVLFSEVMVDDIAEKKAPFSYEDLRNIADKYREEMGLQAHENWHDWIMAKCNSGYREYPDNWAYVCVRHLLIKDTPIDDFYCRRLFLRDIMC